MNSYTIYIIECKNGSYYTGYTTDIRRRYQEHLDGSIKCKYTRANPPKQLAASWNLDLSISNILKIEYAIKKLSKINKTKLIEDNNLTTILNKLNI